jgi:hypothetical protein
MMWYTVESYNSDVPDWTEHWEEAMKTMEILQVLSITTINLMYGRQDKTDSHDSHDLSCGSRIVRPHQPVVLSGARGRVSAKYILTSGDMFKGGEILNRV